LIASEDIVAPTDPWPLFFNIFHAKTQEQVVRRELLLGEGDSYRADLVEETERNLRALSILAVAKIIPVKGAAPDSVGLLVVTKDLWSIRLNSSFLATGLFLHYLRIRPTEQNFLGLGKRLSVDFLLLPDIYALGEGFLDPR